jgi:hypothetical protein
MVLTGQVERECGRAAQPATDHSPWACPVRTRTCSRPASRGTVIDGEDVDLGLVGDVVGVNPAAVLDIHRLQVGSLSCRRWRRISTCRGRSSTSTPTRLPAALAVALGARKLVVLTDVEGVYADWPDKRRRCCRRSERERGASSPPRRASTSGMVPKLEACIRAVDGRASRRLTLSTGGRRTLDPARGLHRRWYRHHGAPGPDPRPRTRHRCDVTPDSSPVTTTTNAGDWLDRYAGSLLGVFGRPQPC